MLNSTEQRLLDYHLYVIQDGVCISFKKCHIFLLGMSPKSLILSEHPEVSSFQPSDPPPSSHCGSEAEARFSHKACELHNEREESGGNQGMKGEGNRRRCCLSCQPGKVPSIDDIHHIFMILDPSLHPHHHWH